MKQITLQELADLLNCYIAKNNNGIVYIYSTKPKLCPFCKPNCYNRCRTKNCWQDTQNNIERIEIYRVYGTRSIEMNKTFISDIHTHHWQELIEPHAKEDKTIIEHKHIHFHFINNL